MYSFITIEGNIGAGKTTLSQLLAKEMDARLILEEFAENSFLPKFYENPEKHAFALELSFMAARYHQLKALVAEPDLFRTVTISDYVFFKSLIFASVNLQEDEATLYKILFNIITAQLTSAELLIYLNTPISRLRKNIIQRGRPYEQNISNEYLEKINEGYFSFFKQLPESKIVIVDNTKLDFVGNSADFDFIQELTKTSFSSGIHYVSK